MLSRFPRLKMLLPLLAIIFVSLVVLRVGFYYYFLADKLDQPPQVFWHAFGIGVRFDLRVALLTLLPLALTSYLPGSLNLRGRLGAPLALILTAITIGTLTFFYITDFAHYAYLDERLNASVLRFADDGMDSVKMVWESYPVLLLLLILTGVTISAALMVATAIRRYRSNAVNHHWPRHLLSAVAVLPMLVFASMGKVGATVPLRWSDAYFSGNQEVAALGLNPVLFFFDTLENATRPYDEDALRQYYPQVADYLGVEPAQRNDFNFSRQVAGRPWSGRLPNVVFVHLESLGANRSGLYGNPMDATPNIDNFARHGFFFPNFMVPSSGTARTVFGLVTGIPDVTWGGSTATRNPLIANQYTLVNAFDGYKKLYFIGGSAGWANIKGVLESGIDDLELWEEGHYDAPNIDVWGISDRELFKAANQRLSALPTEQPFVAFIQLAGNHRPFTIPDDDSEFKVRAEDDEKLQRFGFLAADQYNAIRLLDYNVGFYLNELVANSPYAGNTIFVMYGDHNDRSKRSEHMGYSDALYLDKHHVPMIIYAPGIIDEPRVMPEPASLVDLMPTVLSFIGLPYENRTMGRDVLAEHAENFALTFGGDRNNRPTIGLLGDTYHASMYADGEGAGLYSLANPSLENDVASDQPAQFERQRDMLMGIYQASRYMLLHNRKDRSSASEQ